MPNISPAPELRFTALSATHPGRGCAEPITASLAHDSGGNTMRARALAIFCVAAMLVAGCGTRNQDSATQNQNQNSGNGGDVGTDDTSGGGGGDEADLFGTMPNPCGP